MAKKKPASKRVIQLWINTGYAGCTHKGTEALPEGWDEWDEQEREDYLDQAAQDFLGNHIEYGAEVVGEDEAEDE